MLIILFLLILQKAHGKYNELNGHDIWEVNKAAQNTDSVYCNVILTNAARIHVWNSWS